MTLYNRRRRRNVVAICFSLAATALGLAWLALILTALCYLYILFYAVSGSKPNSERYGGAEARS